MESASNSEAVPPPVASSFEDGPLLAALREYQGSFKSDDWKILPSGSRWMGFQLGAEGDENAPQAWVINFRPNLHVPRHHHDTHRFEVLISGSYSNGDVEARPGDVWMLPAGTTYGPLEIGPDGALALIIFENHSQMKAVWDEEMPETDEKALDRLYSPERLSAPSASY